MPPPSPPDGPTSEHALRVVIAESRMPPTHTTEGLDAARAIRTELPAVGILVLSAHVEVDDALGLLPVAGVSAISSSVGSRTSPSSSIS
jgi:hypothetical protein